MNEGRSCLEDLITSLERGDLRVDGVVSGRLAVLIARLDLDDLPTLQHAIAAAVMTEVQQREAVHHAVKVWAARWPRRPAPPSRPPPPVYPTPIDSVRHDLTHRPDARERLAGMLLSLAAVVLLLLWMASPPLQLPQPSPEARPEVVQPVRSEIITPTIIAPPPRGIQVPEITHTPPAPPTWWAPQLLAAGALTTLLLSGLVLFRRREDPPPPPPPPPAARAPASRMHHPLLLTPRDQDDVVWGMTQHQSDVASQRIDIEATIEATAAAGGIPELRFERRQQQDGAWLWLDRTAPMPELERLADELAHTLDRAGLPYRRGLYYGVPEEVQTARGTLKPAEADDGLRLARVVLLTDGEGWLGTLEGERSRHTQALLAALATWRHVRVVCFGPHLAALERHLAPLGITVLPPARAAEALSDSTTRGAPVTLLDLDPWAGACALLPEPVRFEAALHLRQRLGLRTDPLAWRVLSQPPSDSSVLRWDAVTRATHLNRLSRTAPEVREAALEVWRGYLRRRDGAQPGPAGATTHALLQLWLAPNAAAPVLHRLAHDRALSRRIRRELERMVPAERSAPDAIVLPWQSGSVEPEALAWLEQLGLGAAFDLPPSHARWPGRRAAGLAFLVATLTTAVAGGISWQPPASDTTSLHWPDPRPEGTWSGEGMHPLVVGTRDQWSVQPNKGPGVYRVTLVSRDVQCEAQDGDDLWMRCTSDGAAPPPRAGRPSTSLAVLVGVDRDPMKRVAAALLDTSSVDTVLLTPTWQDLPWPPSDASFQHLVAAEVDRPDAVTVLDWDAFAVELRSLGEPTPLQRLRTVANAERTGAFTLLSRLASCGDGSCDPPESRADCPQDCHRCDDGFCDSPYEDETTCAADCAVCGDGECLGETRESCAVDCAVCGDEHCDSPPEDLASCPEDCHTCGDRVCTPPDEDRTSCARDCAVCGDGSCDRPYETTASCPSDCPPPVTDGDGDGDGIVDAEDACINEPEDHDGWEDADGCPDPDNDGDGIPDVRDGEVDASGFGACRDQPETVNGVDDLDGCPDSIVASASTAAAHQLVWVRVPPGTYTIGSENGSYNEKPQRQVTFEQGFDMLATEVTQAQWSGDPEDSRKPKVSVTWKAAREFCQRQGAELPTELQWEAAARGGTSTKYACGNSASCLDAIAWHSGNSEGAVHEVATRQPNAFGLYDMYGNAWEWVEDCYVEDVWQRAITSTDFVTMTTSECPQRVVRGGSCWNSSRNLTASNRFRFLPTFESRVRGFRCARGPRRQGLELIP